MKLSKNIGYVSSMSLLATVLWSSCSVQQRERPALVLQDTFRQDNKVLELDSSIAKIGYGDFFKDPVLVGLIDKAMAQNNDLQVALKQIDIAEQGYKQAKWLYAPVVQANVGNVSVNRPSNNSMNGMMASQFMGQRYTMDYTSAVNISWELDVWGKIKGQKQEALIDILKTQEASRAVKTRLVTEVVQGYYNLLMLDTQLGVTKENLLFADSTLAIIDKQQQLGIVNSLAVEQQALVVDQIKKSIPALESAIQIQENALSLLTGSMPDRIARKGSLHEVFVPQNLATGVPTELLSYRPDIRSRELDVRRSAASIHVAKVSMYPGLNITAQGGLNALKAHNWFNVPGSLFGLATGTIAQPIFNGRQLRTRYEQAKIAADQAELNFKQSLLGAVGEVSDALIRIEKLQEQEQVAASILGRSSQLVNHALKLYTYNDATYLEVISAQTNKLQAELDVATIKAQKLQAIAVLYRSLGGGAL
ncbi:efflux transporter outer membrane subunit [Sphingobacterium sp. MYb382]|uniref:efflux transporter outer membrane subunit n=1 Tax=Sphingobacterium sp. MYb382 TaxID=2745278 RepID=UPI0030A74C3E